MTSSVKVKVEQNSVLCSYAYTYVCQISGHSIQPFLSYLVHNKVVRNKKNKE